MKWYNKEQTQMINLDKVDAWFYSNEPSDVSPHLMYFINGAQFESEGVEADEIYNILKNEKEMLHS